MKPVIILIYCSLAITYKAESSTLADSLLPAMSIAHHLSTKTNLDPVDHAMIRFINIGKENQNPVYAFACFCDITTNSGNLPLLQDLPVPSLGRYTKGHLEFLLKTDRIPYSFQKTGKKMTMVGIAFKF